MRYSQGHDSSPARPHPRVPARAATALLDSQEWGSEEEVRVAAVWEAIEAVISREELRAAVAIVTEMVPPPDAEGEAEDWRAELVDRITMVSGFVKTFTAVIAFGANAEGAESAAVLTAMRALPEILQTTPGGPKIWRNELELQAPRRP